MENTSLLVFTVLLTVCYQVNSDQPCAAGEKWHTSQDGLVECLMCESGTYMPENEHTFQRCLNCTQIENPDIEVLAVACNRFHDTVILCENGHYRYTAQAPDERDRCEKCSQCPIPEHERGCQEYNNTVCCNPVEGADTTRAGGVLCKKESVVCGIGQFLRTSTDECFPCPAETFMTDHNHVNKRCLQCEKLSENTATHAIIIRPCTRTAPTLFGCKDGYFRDPTQESLQKEVSCTQCRSCDKSLVDCGMFHDAVCVDQDPVTSAAPPNLTESIETSDIDTIKQLLASLNESVSDCISRCTEDELPISQESEAIIRKCLMNCLSVVDKINMVSTWLRAAFGSVLSVLFIVIFRLKQNLAVSKDQTKHRKCFTWFTYVLYAVSFLDIILFIIVALIESKIIEDQGQGSTITLTVICYGSFIVNLARVLMFVRNDTPTERLWIEKGNKVIEERGAEIDLQDRLGQKEEKSDSGSLG